MKRLIWGLVTLGLLSVPVFAQEQGGEEDPAEKLKRIHELMRRAEDLLVNGLETSGKVVEVQKEIVNGLEFQDKSIKNLDDLIRELEEKACGSCNNPSQSQNNQNSSSSSGQQQGEQEQRKNEQSESQADPQNAQDKQQQMNEEEQRRLEALKVEERLRREREMAVELGERWGLLPPKERERIINEKLEEWPVEYQRQIREFLEFINGR